MTGRGAEERSPASTPFGMTDIEEQLLGPDGGQFRRVLSDRFAELGDAIEREIRSGVAPDRYHNLTAIRAALAAARTVVLLFNAK